MVLRGKEGSREEVKMEYVVMDGVGETRRRGLSGEGGKWG